MQQKSSLSFKKSCYFYKQFVLVLFSVFSFLYGSNSYAEDDSFNSFEEMRAKEALALELAKEYEKMEEERNSARLLEEAHIQEALDLAKEYADKHWQIVLILEVAEASEEALRLARERHTNSMKTVSIIESSPQAQEEPSVVRFMNQYKRDMEVESIHQKADIIRSLTALELARKYEEEDRRVISLFENSGLELTEDQLILAVAQHEISVDIVSIIEESNAYII